MKMGTDYYLIVEDKKQKKVGIFYIGRYFTPEVLTKTVEEFDRKLFELESIVEEDTTLLELDEEKINEIQVEQFIKLYNIYKMLLDFATAINCGTTLRNVLEIWAIYNICRRAWISKKLNVEIISEYVYPEVKKKFEEEGYELVIID